jgi:hypothetical protein
MPEPDQPRLIEVAFPHKQASLDSVHEKNFRHGHTSTLHIHQIRGQALFFVFIIRSAVKLCFCFCVRLVKNSPF